MKRESGNMKIESGNMKRESGNMKRESGNMKRESDNMKRESERASWSLQLLAPEHTLTHLFPPRPDRGCHRCS